VHLQDASGVRLFDVQLTNEPGLPLWALTDVAGLRARECAGLPDGDHAAAGPTVIR
jgi:hypothetical protein